MGNILSQTALQLDSEGLTATNAPKQVCVFFGIGFDDLAVGKHDGGLLVQMSAHESKTLKTWHAPRGDYQSSIHVRP